MLLLQVLYGIVVMILVVVVLMAVMGKIMMPMLMMLCDVQGNAFLPPFLERLFFHRLMPIRKFLSHQHSIHSSSD